ncbi:MAG TPA: hypothetical protein DF383_05925 [Deltaproteobacteria bacterium]|nr:hypothetical protein [Deltaproteobacteria bacterium]
MKQANDALRLQSSLKTEAERIAKKEGKRSTVTVAEKLSALRTKEYFQIRAKKGNIKAALKILRRMGTEEAPREGDER